MRVVSSHSSSLQDSRSSKTSKLATRFPMRIMSEPLDEISWHCTVKWKTFHSFRKINCSSQKHITDAVIRSFLKFVVCVVAVQMVG